ncbi:uncharacterized protein J7T54_007539 [Emericellopsis cladophorae]|uniref:A to I editase domain-containing protein n=1 Tax=Emericellopsis cladophorae TaxID=2686198 RepID=A0A9P9XYX9_9HYPO|nr:uncharacterized protein J7T54_007539 [Emericellopsis cladophorae]KAI6780063.1 hypothetical protein J7T54_007539 [Emericellopsis cladophorae]
MASKASLIANSVLAEFDKLPPKRKPSHRGNGHREWVPLSGIVVEHGDHCLPASKIPQANGIVLHDWHAEILAIRTFNRFLLEECVSLIRGDDSHNVDFNTGAAQPFKIKDGIKLHMYCSEAPWSTSVEFAYSKRSVTHTAEKISPSPLATAWSASGIAENIVNGVIQGRKVGDPKGASRMCRQQMWLLAQSLADQCHGPSLAAALRGATYAHVKADALLQSRGQVIADTQFFALKGWIKNSGDTGFPLGQAQRMETS